MAYLHVPIIQFHVASHVLSSHHFFIFGEAIIFNILDYFFLGFPSASPFAVIS